jgi:peptide/nickel transport system permease protein
MFSFFRSFLRSRSALIGLLVWVVILAFALAPGLLAPYDPNKPYFKDRLKPPLSSNSQTYVLGTDQLGRDILSRVIYGARTSVIVGVMVVFISGVLGTVWGLLAGYHGGLADSVLMRLVDIQLAFPFILLAIAIIGGLGTSVRNVILVIGLASWVPYARVVRGESLAIREKAYIESARSIGASSGRIMWRHVLPNVAPSMIVIATFGLANAIIMEAGLSFLGMGVPLEIPSWGGMLADGRQFVDTSWWLAVFPGLAIFFAVLATNLLGDQLRDVLDPYIQAGRG